TTSLTPFSIGPSFFLYAAVAWPDLPGINVDSAVSTAYETKTTVLDMLLPPFR
ncbi:unnamed protein product, partial [marine sediment metagenome]